MANCPKCNAKLKLTDWRPECPKCGVNMVYYGMEERLLADAEKAEAEHAKFQKGLDRFKASSIGGGRQIARLILSIIPAIGLVLGLLLPALSLATINLSNIPYYGDNVINVNMVTVVEFFMNYFDVNGLLGVIGSEVVGTPFILFAVSIVCLALSIVMGIVNFGRNFCSSKASSCKKNIIVSVLSMVLIIAAGIVFDVFGSNINAIFPTFIEANLGIGVFVTAALHIPVIAVNATMVKNPIVVKYTELPDYGAKEEEAPAEEAVAAE